ncbi:MAG: ABC transporter permease [Spirochaetaceae bacterium]|jgi:simple sugar transport system permease protein|nr:ABC transporter permease [Spirochaetaceae bacterium]
MTLLYAAAPMLLAALGALLTESAGFLLIGIEGFMVLGSFGGFVLTVFTGSAAAGALITAVLCSFTGFLLARFVRKSGADRYIAGIALNLAAQGLCGVLSLRFFGTGGVLRDVSFTSLPLLSIPLLEKLPVLGQRLSPVPPFVYIAFIVLIAEAVFLKSSAAGFRLKAVGLSEDAAVLERGIHPWRYREGSWAAAAFLAALAGCALSFRVGVYSPGGIGSRAWIALALVFLGFRSVWGILAASLVFAFAETLSYSAQGFFQGASTVFLGLPPALALLLYVTACKFRKL